MFGFIQAWKAARKENYLDGFNDRLGAAVKSIKEYFESIGFSKSSVIMEFDDDGEFQIKVELSLCVYSYQRETFYRNGGSELILTNLRDEGFWIYETDMNRNLVLSLIANRFPNYFNDGWETAGLAGMRHTQCLDFINIEIPFTDI